MDAFFKVKEKNGAPGIDGVTVQEFGENLTKNIEEIKQELKDKTYQPSPVKRVYIDKGNGEKRSLGIPTVKDRVVQQRIGYVKRLFEKLDGWMRRRIRMVQMRSWRTPNTLIAILEKKGIKGNFKRISMTSWKNSACQMAHLAMDIEWFNQRGWHGLTDIRNKLLSEKG
jgi:hypothetical protein